jgi:hypothetical protein
MSTHLVIYHGSCADGFGAAFAAWLKLGDAADYVAVQYGQDFSPSYLCDIAKREVFILGFSFPREEMDRLFEMAKRVVWLDHHKTAFEMWCGGIPEDGVHREMFSPAGRMGGDEGWHCPHDIALSNNKSGALLAWEYFHPGTDAPMLIRHIDDYDRWQFKLEGTKEFNKALWSYAPWSFEQWDEKFYGPYSGAEYSGAEYYSDQVREQLITEGAAILRAHYQNVRELVRRGARRVYIPSDENMKGVFDTTVNGLAANCPPHLTSDVGHELATQSGTFGLCWTLSKEGMVAQCSLRSNDDYDVSEIAKAFGGGGHKNAAGFEVPIATLLGWLG